MQVSSTRKSEIPERLFLKSLSGKRLLQMKFNDSGVELKKSEIRLKIETYIPEIMLVT